MDSQLLPLSMWEPQLRLHRVLEDLRTNNKLQRVVVLKARREGVSTYAEARIFWASHLNENTESVIIAHEKDSGKKIFNMCRLYFDCMPERLRPMIRYSSKQELVFENPDAKTRPINPGLRSSIEVLTAGKKNVARGAGYHNLHASELGSWQFPEDVLPALLPTIPKNVKSLIIYESTAKGVGNYFHNEWLMAEEGESNFVPFFLAWYDLPYYFRQFNTEKERDTFSQALNEEEKELRVKHGLSVEQLYWRRTALADYVATKGGEQLFRQEFPATPEEAFIVSGVPIFNRDKLRKMALRCTKPEFSAPKFRGHVIDRGLLPDKEYGELKIWAFPRKGNIYVMGVDVSDGGVDGDYSCIEIFRLLPKNVIQFAEQVAEWHGRISPVGLANIVERLGLMYNEALASVEVDSYGRATQEELKRTYWNIYQQQYLDRFDSKLTKKLGWETTTTSKKLLISIGSHCIFEENIVIRSSDLVREFMTFVRDSSGGASAAGTGYDDRVMAALICLFTMHQSMDPTLMDDEKLVTVASNITIPPNYVDKDFAEVLAMDPLDGFEQHWMNY